MRVNKLCHFYYSGLLNRNRRMEEARIVVSLFLAKKIIMYNPISCRIIIVHLELPHPCVTIVINRVRRHNTDYTEQNSSGDRVTEWFIENTFQEENMYTFVAKERRDRNPMKYITCSKDLEWKIENVIIRKQPELETLHRIATANLMKDLIEEAERNEQG